MRSISLVAASTVILTAAWACGGDGGGVEPNNPPVANFTAPSCTAGTACQFTDASTDDHGISTREWDFGDLTPKSNDQNPAHTYATQGDYTVSLKVTDAAGESNTKSQTVTVAPATPGNQPPVASFDLPTCTAGTPCGFHSTSTDADGDIAAATFDWDFGDQQTGEGADATHTYSAPGTFNVTLTVADDKGARGSVTQAVTVSPQASQDCTTNGTMVDCTLGITQQSTVKITIQDPPACELSGNKITVTAPVAQTVFFNLCNRSQGEEYTVKDGSGTGAALVFTAGSQLSLRFFQGTADPGDPATGDPGITVTGTFPTWTLHIDDGGAAGRPGEPDFNDTVLTVTATSAP